MCLEPQPSPPARSTQTNVTCPRTHTHVLSLSYLERVSFTALSKCSVFRDVSAILHAATPPPRATALITVPHTLPLSMPLPFQYYLLIVFTPLTSNSFRSPICFSLSSALLFAQVSATLHCSLNRCFQRGGSTPFSTTTTTCSGCLFCSCAVYRTWICHSPS